MVLLYVFCALVLLLLAAAWYMGLFMTVQFTETQTQDAIWIYTEHVGPYSNVGAIFHKLMAAKADILRTVEKARCAMISFDNPRMVEAAKLRSECGLWLPASCGSEVDAILEKVASATGLSLAKRELTSVKALHFLFPFRNMLSFFLGPMKVYPAARNPKFGLVQKMQNPEPCGKQGCPMEIYHDDSIEFIFPLEHPEQYVHSKNS